MEKIFTGMQQGPEAIQRNFDELLQKLGGGKVIPY